MSLTSPSKALTPCICVLSSVLKESIKGYVDSLKQVRRSILGKDMY